MLVTSSDGAYRLRTGKIAKCFEKDHRRPTSERDLIKQGPHLVFFMQQNRNPGFTQRGEALACTSPASKAVSRV
jgi:hypothetical protein